MTSARILHVSMLASPLNSSRGFAQQIVDEGIAASQLRSAAIQWDVLLILKAPPPPEYAVSSPIQIRVVPKGWGSPLLMRLYKWMTVAQRSRHYDHVLVRYSAIDPLAPLFLKKLRNVYPVRHSKADREIAASGSSLLADIEQRCSRAIGRSAAAMIGVTTELAAYHSLRDTPRFVLPNGINTQEAVGPAGASRQNHSVEKGRPIEVVFACSQFSPWYGLENMIAAAREWTGSEQSPAIRVHLAGALSDRQIALLDDAERESVLVQFVRHGSLNASALHELYRTADIAFGPLNLQTVGLKDASTLKVREYLSAGLPVYATSQDSAIPRDFPYYVHDDQIDLDNVVAFARRVATVEAHEVRQQSCVYIDKASCMRQMVTDLQQWHDSPAR